MDEVKKERICTYLYGTDETRKFLLNDLFQEFSLIIDDKECINWKNRIKKVRTKNKIIVTTKIVLFLKENEVYYNKLDKIYNNMLFKDVITMLVLGYVFYLSQVKDEFKDVNIFKSKKSICYSSEPTIYDVAI